MATQNHLLISLKGFTKIHNQLYPITGFYPLPCHYLEELGKDVPCNQKEDLKLSQYADVTNLFIITEKSIVGILNLFEKYEIATGATINTSKTITTPLANAKIYNLYKNINNLQINNPKNFIKILDIYFSNDL